MTGESMHTASKERMGPELMFLSEQHPLPPAIKYCFESAVAIMLPFQLCSARYTVLQTKKVEVSLQQSSHHKITTIHMPQLSITASKVQLLLYFAFSYFQPITQHYK